MKQYTDLRIVIADDHAIIRKGIISLLKEHGISVEIEASNGLELIKKLENIKYTPDICILDIGMPEFDGFETINVLNNKWPTIKTLVFTTLQNKYSLIKMLGYGAKGYLLKQGNTMELYRAVCEINDVGYYHSEIEIKCLSHSIENIIEFKKEIFNEKEILFIKYCCSELTYKEIAAKMNIGLRTVDNYRNDIFLRLNLKSRIGLVMYALSCGIVS